MAASQAKLVASQAKLAQASQAKLAQVVLALQAKLAAMEELQAQASQAQASQANVAANEAQNTGRKRRRGKKTKPTKRKVAGPGVKKLRDKFKTAFFQRVDARYLAPEKSYKMYADSCRGETIQIDKFIKIAGPIVKRIIGADDDEVECIKEVRGSLRLFFIALFLLHFAFYYCITTTDAKMHEEKA